MNFPEELKYSKSHEWVRFEDDGTAAVGITDYAQDKLGDIVYVSLPEEGDAFGAGDSVADIESVKAVSGVITPVSGKVCAVNSELENEPEKINEDPYGSWLVRMEDISDEEDLLDAADYEKFVEEEKAKE